MCCSPVLPSLPSQVELICRGDTGQAGGGTSWPWRCPQTPHLGSHSSAGTSPTPFCRQGSAMGLWGGSEPQLSSSAGKRGKGTGEAQRQPLVSPCPPRHSQRCFLGWHRGGSGSLLFLNLQTSFTHPSLVNSEFCTFCAAKTLPNTNSSMRPCKHHKLSAGARKPQGSQLIFQVLYSARTWQSPCSWCCCSQASEQRHQGTDIDCSNGSARIWRS